MRKLCAMFAVLVATSYVAQASSFKEAIKKSIISSNNKFDAQAEIATIADNIDDIVIPILTYLMAERASDQNVSERKRNEALILKKSLIAGFTRADRMINNFNSVSDEIIKSMSEKTFSENSFEDSDEDIK